MKRSIKNIITILLIFLFLLFAIITVNTAKTNSSNMMQIPNQNFDNSSNMPNQMPGGQVRKMQNPQNISIWFVLLVFENIAIALLVIYLIMSGLYQKSFRETFRNTDKLIIYFLSSVLLVIILSFIGSSLINTKNNSDIIRPKSQSDSSSVVTANDFNSPDDKSFSSDII